MSFCIALPLESYNYREEGTLSIYSEVADRLIDNYVKRMIYSK